MIAKKLSREFVRLIKMMRLKKSSDTDPFTLILGSGAAPISMEDFEKEVLRAYGWEEDKIDSMSVEERTNTFCNAWEQLGESGRFDCLYDSFRKKVNGTTRVGAGYEGLARLIKAGYFNVIFTTNVDTLLEDALITAGMLRETWQLFINGKDKLVRLSKGLNYPIPRIKILKLHGDLYSRVFAFSHTEVYQFSLEVETLLKEYLSRPMLIVENSMRDFDIIRCIPASGDDIYYVNDTQPRPGTNIHQALKVRNSVTISGNEANFDFFFSILGGQILGGDEPDEIGLETLEKVGIEIDKLSERKVETALRNTSLIEIIGELEETDQNTPKPKNLLVEDVTPTLLYIRYGNDQRLSFAIEGKIKYESNESETLRIDAEELNRLLQYMGRDIATYHSSGSTEDRASWRERAKREGKILFKDIFVANGDLMQKLGMARQAAGDEENLYLCFAGPRNYLGMPYELLYESKPLALMHPMCRQVTGVPTISQSFGDFIVEMRRYKKSLRVLLIASDTGNLDVDHEVQELAKDIKKKADSLNLLIEINIVPTEEASLKAVSQLLNKCDYHIVHYAGHGYFDKISGAGSGLLFWEQKNRKGKKARLTASALAQLLSGSKTRLFYLSSCLGAAIGGEHLLYNNDYLGVTDAVVQAGVPIVFAYRWYVLDGSARQFALNFYSTLFETRSPAVATFYARRALYMASSIDETWTSPILVTQKL